MQENTVQTLIDTIKDLTGQTNLNTEKAIRGINYGVDDYTRISINASGKWRQDSRNHGDISRITATLKAGNRKLSLPTELIAIRQLEILIAGKWQIVDPTDIHDNADTPLETAYDGSGTPMKYDYDSNHLYFYPTSSEDRTVRLTYSRNHPRFTASNLTQSVGVLPIDDEYVALYGADYVMIGQSDSARAAVAQKLADKQEDIRTTFANLDQDTHRVLRPAVKSAFTRNSFKQR